MAIPEPIRPTGTHLYKYGSNVDWLKVIILQHEIYLPAVSQLNDPADGFPKIAVQSADELIDFLFIMFIRRNPHLTVKALRSEEAIIRFNVHLHGPHSLHPNLVKALDSEVKDFRTYSMSKGYNKLNLWAHYTANHRGYCMEFANEGPLFEHAKEINYINRADIAVPITDPAFRNGWVFFSKVKEDWSNEDEVRLLLPRNMGSKVKIDPVWLTRLILGKDMSEATREQIRVWARSRSPELVVVNARFDPIDRSIQI